MVKKCGRVIQFEMDENLHQQVQQWLDLHPEYDMSRLINKAVLYFITKYPIWPEKTSEPDQ